LSVTSINASGSTGGITVSASGAIGGITFTPGTGISTITTGAGADTLTAGTARAVFSSGNGADTLTGGAGNDNLTSGAGNDTISTGAGTDNVTAGAGTDTITLGTGAKTIYIATGESTTTTAFSSISDGMSVAGADIITGVGVGDSIVVTSFADAYDNASGTLSTGTNGGQFKYDNSSYTAIGDNTVGLIRGVYSSGLFSSSSAGSDTLFVYDDNSTVGGQTYRTIILQGSTVDNLTIDNSSSVFRFTFID
jgi:hypothetical protein